MQTDKYIRTVEAHPLMQVSVKGVGERVWERVWVRGCGREGVGESVGERVWERVGVRGCG